MKKTATAKDKASVYRTFGLGKIDAPVKKDNAPRVTKTVGKGDMRGGNK